MNIAIAVLLGSVLQSQLVTRDPIPYDTDQTFKFDFDDSCAPFINNANTLTDLQAEHWASRMCAIWNRVTLSDISCYVDTTVQDIWNGATPDFTSGVSYGPYPNAGAVASTNWYVAPPFNHEVDIMWFCGDIDHKWHTCAQQSGYPYNNACTSDANCHSTQTCVSGFCSNTCPATFDGDLNFSASVFGGNSVLSFQTTGLHEFGHRMGLQHPNADTVCGFAPCDSEADCPAGTGCSGTADNPGNCFPDDQICPVMTGGARDAYWPNSDDTETVRQARSIVVQYSDISSSGNALGLPTGGCTFANASTFVAPQVSCRPNNNASTSDCVVSWRGSSAGGQRFSFIDTPTNLNTACSVTNTYESTNRSDGAVDVAWGGFERVLGVGVRPPSVTSHKGEIVIYRILPTGLESQLFLADELGFVDSSIRAHTEARISYHETSDRFMVAYVDHRSNVRLLSLNAQGRPLSTSGAIIPPFDTGFNSVLPPQIVCDAHSPGNVGFCYLYVQPLSSVTAIEDGSMIMRKVVFLSDGTISHAIASSVETGAQVQFIGDGGTYGNGAVSGQPTGNGIWLSSQPKVFSSINDVRFIFDDQPDFTSASVYNNTYLGMSAFNAGARRAHASGLDCNETIARFVFATAKN